MRLPGDRKSDPRRMMRVDHAGEYGATRIYAGQLAVMGDRHPLSGELRRMAAAEDRHLATFDRLLPERRVRPTLLHPLWRVAGYALGAATALMGPKAAMACTAAVETEIDRHYEEQRQALLGTDAEFEAVVEDFQAEEVEHRESAIAHGAEDALAYPLLSAVIRAGCRVAIKASERL